jgi:DNA-binding MarR family transcriptional regulator
MQTTFDKASLGGLTRAQGDAWGRFLRAHAELVREMSADLEARHGMPLSSYDVLRQLALAPGERLRMAELADAVMLSRPGLTGVVKRLEQQGLIARAPTPEDGRGSYAVLTAAGADRLLEVHGAHVAAIRERFASHFSADELRTLGALLGRLVSAE